MTQSENTRQFGNIARQLKILAAFPEDPSHRSSTEKDDPMKKMLGVYSVLKHSPIVRGVCLFFILCSQWCLTHLQHRLSVLGCQGIKQRCPSVHQNYKRVQSHTEIGITCTTVLKIQWNSKSKIKSCNSDTQNAEVGRLP